MTLPPALLCLVPPPQLTSDTLASPTCSAWEALPDPPTWTAVLARSGGQAHCIPALGGAGAQRQRRPGGGRVPGHRTSQRGQPTLGGRIHPVPLRPNSPGAQISAFCPSSVHWSSRPRVAWERGRCRAARWPKGGTLNQVPGPGAPFLPVHAVRTEVWGGGPPDTCALKRLSWAGTILLTVLKPEQTVL